MAAEATRNLILFSIYIFVVSIAPVCERSLLFGPDQSWAQSEYVVSEIGSELPPQAAKYYNKLSNSGLVAGSLAEYPADNLLGTSLQLFMSDEALSADGSTVNLHDDEWMISYPVDINVAGEIIFRRMFGDSPFNLVFDTPLRRAGGEIVLLPPLPGLETPRPMSLSDVGGIVVGQSENSPYPTTVERATIWYSSNPVPLALDDLATDRGAFALETATAVSPNGQFITGRARSVQTGEVRRYLYKLTTNQFELLDLSDIGSNNLPVNNLGDITGSVREGPSVAGTAFFKPRGEPLLNLHEWPGSPESSQGIAINDCGEVLVKHFIPGSAEDEVLIWSAEQGMQAFSSKLPEDFVASHTFEHNGWEMNNSGWVVGHGERDSDGAEKVWVFTPEDGYTCESLDPPVQVLSTSFAFSFSGSSVTINFYDSLFCSAVEGLWNANGGIFGSPDLQLLQLVAMCADIIPNTCNDSDDQPVTFFHRFTRLFGFDTPDTGPFECFSTDFLPAPSSSGRGAE